MKWILTIALMFVSVNTNAEDWQNIGDDENLYYFDIDSIKSRYSLNGELIVSMWTMFPNPDPITEKGIAAQMLNYANCSDMSLKHAELLEIDADGEVVWRLSQMKNKIDLSSVMPLDYYYPKQSDTYFLNLEVMCDPTVIELGFENAKL